MRRGQEDLEPLALCSTCFQRARIMQLGEGGALGPGVGSLKAAPPIPREFLFPSEMYSQSFRSLWPPSLPGLLEEGRGYTCHGRSVYGGTPGSAGVPRT